MNTEFKVEFKVKDFIGIAKAEMLKEGAFFVAVSESIPVSGYGSTIQEAKKSFMINLDIFQEDMESLTDEEREKELIGFGYQK